MNHARIPTPAIIHDAKRRFSCYIARFLKLVLHVYTVLVDFPGQPVNTRKSHTSGVVPYQEISLCFRPHVQAMHESTGYFAGLTATQLYDLRITRASRMLVFVIEDHPLLRQVLEETLKRDNHVVVPFANAEAALLWSTNVIPDVILTDVNLVEGRMSGVEFVRRHREQYGIIPVVFVTALPGIRDVVRYVAESCYITKPFLNTDITYALAKAEYWNRIRAKEQTQAIPTISKPEKTEKP